MADASPFEDFEAEEVPQGNGGGGADEFDFEGTGGAAGDEAVDMGAAGADEVKDDEDPFAAAAAGGGAAEEDAAASLGYNADPEPSPAAGPTPLEVWQAERVKVLAARVAKAEADRAELAELGKREIEKFYADQATKLKKTQAEHRLDEKVAREDMDNLMKNGTMWEKVAKMVDLQPGKNEERKVARMRKLLFQLKNDKPGAAGIKV